MVWTYLCGPCVSSFLLRIFSGKKWNCFRKTRPASPSLPVEFQTARGLVVVSFPCPFHHILAIDASILPGFNCRQWWCVDMDEATGQQLACFRPSMAQWLRCRMSDGKVYDDTIHCISLRVVLRKYFNWWHGMTCQDICNCMQLLLLLLLLLQLLHLTGTRTTLNHQVLQYVTV